MGFVHSVLFGHTGQCVLVACANLGQEDRFLGVFGHVDERGEVSAVVGSVDEGVVAFGPELFWVANCYFIHLSHAHTVDCAFFSPGEFGGEGDGLGLQHSEGYGYDGKVGLDGGSLCRDANALLVVFDGLYVLVFAYVETLAEQVRHGIVAVGHELLVAFVFFKVSYEFPGGVAE